MSHAIGTFTSNGGDPWVGRYMSNSPNQVVIGTAIKVTIEETVSSYSVMTIRTFVMQHREEVLYSCLNKRMMMSSKPQWHVSIANKNKKSIHNYQTVHKTERNPSATPRRFVVGLMSDFSSQKTTQHDCKVCKVKMTPRAQAGAEGVKSAMS